MEIATLGKGERKTKRKIKATQRKNSSNACT